MTSQSLRMLLLSGLAFAGASIAAPAGAALAFDPGAFSVTESPEGGGGRYTVHNNSHDWFIYRFEVTNPLSTFTWADTTQDNWIAENCGSGTGCANGEGTVIEHEDPYFSYFNNDPGAQDDFAHMLGFGSFNGFTFGAPPASDYRIFLTNEAGGLQEVTGSTDGVPEPAVWSMMIMGFGLAGAALRRRRTPAATA